MENEMTDQKNDGLPCVSCGKPSDTCTTDDADMCWPCYGSFQATAFDNLKKKFVTLIRRDYPGVDLEKALDELASLPTSSDNSWVDARVNITTPESTEYRQGWERGWNACIDEIATRGPLRTTPEDAKGDEWQPIETAPRDKVFCVWMPFGTMYTQCRWREDRGCAENHFGLLPEATHWTIPHGPTTQQPEHEGE